MTVQDTNKLFKYWLDEADYSFEILQLLMKKNKYSEAMFFGHLTLEKLLKAYIVLANKEHAPPIHDLLRLVKKTDLIISADDAVNLETITGFNLAGRYDEEKQQFRKQCTAAFSKKYFDLVNHYRLWLKKEISQKQSAR